MKTDLSRFHPFVRKTASKWSAVLSKNAQDKKNIFEELYHEGLLALYESASRFDPSRETPFLAFASPRVKGAIVDFIRRSPEIRIPHKKFRELKNFNETREALALELGREPEDREIARRMNVTIDQILQYETLSTVSPEELKDQASEPETPLKSYLKEKLAADMDHCMDGLSTQEKLVLLARKENITLKTLGLFFDISIESVRRREKSGATLLRECLEKLGWSVEDLD